MAEAPHKEGLGSRRRLEGNRNGKHQGEVRERSSTTIPSVNSATQAPIVTARRICCFELLFRISKPWRSQKQADKQASKRIQNELPKLKIPAESQTIENGYLRSSSRLRPEPSRGSPSRASISPGKSMTPTCASVMDYRSVRMATTRRTVRVTSITTAVILRCDPIVGDDLLDEWRSRPQ